MATPFILYPAIQGPPGIALEKDIEARWHQPLSTPPKHLAARALAGAILAGSLFWYPGETVSLDKWHAPLSQPVLRKPSVGWQQSLALVAPALLPDAQSVGRWLLPLAEPVRPKSRQTALYAGEVGWSPSFAGFVAPSLASWHVPFPVPRAHQPRQVGLLAYPADTTSPSVAGFFPPLTEPVRFKRDPRYRATHALLGEAFWPTAQPAGDNANVRWHRPLAEPVRFKRDPRYGALLTGGESSWSMIAPNPTPSVLRPVSMRQTLLGGSGSMALLAGGAGTGLVAGQGSGSIRAGRSGSGIRSGRGSGGIGT